MLPVALPLVLACTKLHVTAMQVDWIGVGLDKKIEVR